MNKFCTFRVIPVIRISNIKHTKQPKHSIYNNTLSPAIIPGYDATSFISRDDSGSIINRGCCGVAKRNNPVWISLLYINVSILLWCLVNKTSKNGKLLLFYLGIVNLMDCGSWLMWLQKFCFFFFLLLLNTFWFSCFVFVARAICSLWTC